MTTIGERKHVTLEVRKVAKVEGLYGPQYELEVKLPWSKFPSKLWLDIEDGVDEPAAGSHSAVLEVTGLKDGKSGSAPFDWNYRLVSLDSGPVPNSPQTSSQAAQDGRREAQGGSQYSGPPDDRQAAISWAQAINCAIQIVGPFMSDDNPYGTRGEYLDALTSWATDIYPIIRKGPPPVEQAIAENATPEPDSFDAEFPAHEVSMEEVVAWIHEQGIRANTLIVALPLPNGYEIPKTEKGGLDLPAYLQAWVSAAPDRSLGAAKAEIHTYLLNRPAEGE